MKKPVNAAVQSIEASFSGFARNHMATLTGLGTLPSFPDELWGKMGAKNLLDPTLFNGPEACLSITRAGMALVQGGGNLGMTLSWMIHHLVARYLFFPENFKGNNKDHESLFQDLSSGKGTICFAVSEPGAGAHPKYMTATATPCDSGYIINGEKTYLTNGPIANGFIVIAITGYEGERKQFSAFFIPENTRGLTILSPMDVPFFRPSPHNGIVLKNCRVPENALLGKKGQAFRDKVLTFRRIEEAAMTGPVTGAMAFLMDALILKMADSGNTYDGFAGKFARLAPMLETAKQLSWDFAVNIDDPVSSPGQKEIFEFKELVIQFMQSFESLVDKMDVCLPDPCAVLIHDLKSSGSIVGKPRSKR